ncbi:leucine-rich repeat-containing protein 49 [Neocloeon triangulifer]|uniref:leucine-rich repeat-containing protein 49 n=1 Tax=Neocloeon triangulifer TaxID=2078957 RepID=UPI00286EE4D9|nr:leucine-rich repeat-containing protein 49 [Neocloeon triangulifer]
MPSRSSKVSSRPPTCVAIDKRTNLGVLGRPALGPDNNDWKKASGQPLPALANRPRLLKRAYSTLSFGDLQGLSTTKADPQVQRNEKDRERNPDRLSLDRMGLTTVPALAGEEGVRLLSLQHNLITRLEGLSALPRLVFLDLYDNQVEKLVGVKELPSIKVLLLGKNRVRRLEGLELLPRLEVLDLHGNQLTSLTGLNPLSELKVLNVAGNQLRVVSESDLKGLGALEELNLRRNRIRRVEGVAHAPKLAKLFLSNNNIHSVEELNGVRQASQLKELSIDGNPVSENAECAALLVTSLSTLKLLNGSEVTNELRNVAATWHHAPISDKKQAISNARMHWELLRSQAKTLIHICANEHQTNLKTQHPKEANSGELAPLRLPPICLAPGSNSSSSGSEASSSSDSSTRCESVLSNSASSSVEPNIDSCATSPRSEICAAEAVEEEQEDEERPAEDGETLHEKIIALTQPVQNQRPVTAQPSRAWQQVRGALRSGQVSRLRVRTAKPQIASPQKQQPVRNKTATSNTKEQGGDYLVEIEGKCLNVYGQTAIKFLDRPWNPQKAVEVQTIKFTYISFNSVVTQFSKLKQRFPSAEKFSFKESNIYCLGQLNALAELQGIHSLLIEQEGNPIVFKEWQSYAIFRLAHWGLVNINGQEISKQQVEDAEREYAGLCQTVLDCMPGSLLLPLLGRLSLEAGQPLPPPSPNAAKEWLLSTDCTFRNVVAKEALQWRRGIPSQEELVWRQKGRVHLSTLIESGYGAVEKLKILEQTWNEILLSQVQDTLLDFSQMEMYMKQCISKLFKQ